MTRKSSPSVSRRNALKASLAAAVGGGATVLAAGGAQAPGPFNGGGTPSSRGQRFRGYVRFGTGASVQELKLLPISPRQVVLRAEAAQICYTTTPDGLRTTPVPNAFLPGHGGVGTVIQDLCKGKTARHLAGGGNVGPDFVIEAVGGDLFPPKTEVGPDPTGIKSLQQAWDLCSPVGHVITLSGGHPVGSIVSIPANQWANGAKSHQPGNLAGANPLRDIPRFVRLIEAGRFNARALATATFPLERSREAFQAAADRTTIAAVMVFS